MEIRKCLDDVAATSRQIQYNLWAFRQEHLRNLGFELTNEIFAENSKYFRNSLVRANYTNMQYGIIETTEYLERFFRNLLMGEQNELKSRYMIVGTKWEENKKEDSTAVSVSALTPCELLPKSLPLHIHINRLWQTMKSMTSDARYEKAWHQYLAALESQPRLRLAPFLRSLHVYQRGFEKWMYSHGYSVGDAKGRVSRLRMDAQSSGAPDAFSCLVPVNVREDTANPQSDLLTGISLTLPDGTVVSIRRGSAEAVVSFLKLYSGEGSPCSD